MFPPRRFLFIDDDQDDRYIFTSTLKKVDSEIECVSLKNGQEGLNYLTSEKSLPAVIFLDINMPLVNGWELLAEIKKNPDLVKIPVIIYSTSSNQRDVERAFEAGAVGFCTKPDNISDLTEILQFTVNNLHDLSPQSTFRSGIPAFKRAGIDRS